MLLGRPTTYRTTNEFLKMFGISSLDELPELPKYKLDENEQIVLEDYENSDISLSGKEDMNSEAPMPEREEVNENNE